MTIWSRVNDQLAPGSYQANVDLTYSGAGFTNQISIPVTYRMTALPFDRMTHPVTFGDVEAQSVTHVSDTELRVRPPAFATPGAYTVSIQNDRGFATSVARYMVVAPQPYAAATVDLGVGNVFDGSPKQLIYDAERQAVYFNRRRRLRVRAPCMPTRLRWIDMRLARSSAIGSLSIRASPAFSTSPCTSR